LPKKRLTSEGKGLSGEQKATNHVTGGPEGGLWKNRGGTGYWGEKEKTGVFEEVITGGRTNQRVHKALGVMGGGGGLKVIVG